jgi:hypothetical protein
MPAKIGRCQMCGEEKPLIKAHIIPRTFFSDLKRDREILSHRFDIEALHNTANTKRLNLSVSHSTIDPTSFPVAGFMKRHLGCGTPSILNP